MSVAKGESKRRVIAPILEKEAQGPAPGGDCTYKGGTSSRPDNQRLLIESECGPTNLETGPYTPPEHSLEFERQRYKLFDGL